jgi:rRNA maturation endonuclease Nob1
MTSLGGDGLAKVKAGVTTPDELLRVVTEVREVRAVCPACKAQVSSEFVACPACGHRVGGGCPHCHKPIDASWKFCPYCAKSTDSRAPVRRLRRREVRELPAAVSNVSEFKK